MEQVNAIIHVIRFACSVSVGQDSVITVQVIFSIIVCHHHPATSPCLCYDALTIGSLGI